MQLRGRHWIVAWLTIFVVVAALVVTRQSEAIQVARRIRELKTRRTELLAEQIEIRRQIEAATSRQVLMPRATALGLHLPTPGTESRLFRLRVSPKPVAP